jgi:hypothetical protein
MPTFKKETRKCLFCRKEFFAVREHHKHCSSACRAGTFRKSHPCLSPEEAEIIRQLAKKMGIILDA